MKTYGWLLFWILTIMIWLAEEQTLLKIATSILLNILFLLAYITTVVMEKEDER